MCCSHHAIKSLDRRPEAQSIAFFNHYCPCIREPICTLTNIFFPFWSLIRMMDTTNKITEPELWCLLMLIGYGSALHHAILQPGSIILDWIPISVTISYVYSRFGWNVFSLTSLWSNIWCLLAISILILDHCQYLLRFYCVISNHERTLYPKGPHDPTFVGFSLLKWAHPIWHTVAAYALYCVFTD
jgi:hypothetical protein